MAQVYHIPYSLSLPFVKKLGFMQQAHRKEKLMGADLIANAVIAVLFILVWGGAITGIVFCIRGK